MNAKKLRNGMRMIAAASALVLSVGGPAALASVDVTGSNEITGSSSTNVNTYDIDNSATVTVDNDGDATSTVSLAFDTGNNDVIANTTVGDIEGGDVVVDGRFESRVNVGAIDLDMSGSSSNVSLDLSNKTTGANSVNRNNVDIDNSSTVSVNNTADTTNTFGFDINTGQNDIRNNTTVGDVSTGGIRINIGTENVSNSSTSSLDLSGALGGSDVSADFSNGTTGFNSLNRNTLDLNNTSSVTVNNTGTVTNTVGVTGDSGNNDVRNNTTVGDIKTGSVSVNFDTVNRVN